MARFMMVYKGEATDMGDMSEEQAGAVMAAWGVWMGKVGPALVDVGTPLGAGASVVDDGSPGSAVSLTGYSIVEAADMAGAKALANGHPFLSEGKGNFAVDIFEMLPVPM
ncbi:MAG: YciI family protein [Acidimicrobiia bacterium]|nr:YciI family protein [Acidimicrobiia bacterium]